LIWKYVENRNIAEVSLSQLYYDSIINQIRKGKDNMNFIESMLSKKIEEAEPSLDLQGADRKVLQVAIQDFTNYLNFSSNFEKKETNILDQAKQMEQLREENSAEFDSSLSIWSGIWIRKWKQRINLLIGKQSEKETSKAPENVSKNESLWTKLECKEEIIAIVVSALIKNAEICGTRVIAENIVKMETCKRSSQDINSKEQVLKILDNSLRRAREITQITGPLIAIKVDKRYYCEAHN
jgi:hypothetical protein